jgi:hypothetical protein
MIVGLTGAKGSGKDTVGAYLVKEHAFERKAFADPLKQSIAALFGIAFSDIDKLKNDPEAFVGVYTFRTFIQRYGTEAHRDVFGQNFWVDITLPLGGYYPGRAIVVTDVRFRNEAERVRYLGGYNWHIHRKAAPENPLQHSSELFDYDDLIDSHIHNDDTLQELFDNVERTLSLVKVYEET